MPLVSVIIPIYKVEKYLKECLDSVINQTCKNLEIILVDDGSPDYCGKICDEYVEKDNRVKVIHKVNGGVSSARNTGIEVACGEWIYFMDSDDYIEPNTIESALNYAIENNCDMCMFDYDSVYKDKTVSCNALKLEEGVFNDLDNIDVFIDYACVMGSIWNFITKADIIKKLKFDEELSMREDEIFKFQLYEKIKSFCYLKVPFYHYIYRSDSAVHSCHNVLRTIDNNCYVYNKETEIISIGNYPINALKAVHSKYLESFWSICSGIFAEKISFKEKIDLYINYINTEEFKEAITDFTDIYFSRITKLCLKNYKAPHWFFIYVLVKIRDLRNFFIKKEKF